MKRVRKLARARSFTSETEPNQALIKPSLKLLTKGVPPYFHFQLAPYGIIYKVFLANEFVANPCLNNQIRVIARRDPGACSAAVCCAILTICLGNRWSDFLKLFARIVKLSRFFELLTLLNGQDCTARCAAHPRFLLKV